MRIAVVGEDRGWNIAMRALFPDEENIDYFVTHEDFGKAELGSYSAIFLDYDLSGMNGEEIAKGIQGKTRAMVALMGGKNGWISKNIVKNGYIHATLDKTKPQQFIDFLESVRHRDIMKNRFREAMDTLNRIDQMMSRG